MADLSSSPQDETKSDPATARAFAKLEAALKAGDCYGALQLYRTVVKRRIDAGAAGEAASLVARGAETLAAHGRPAEAGDLCEMLVKSYEATSTPLTRDSVDAVTGAARAFASRGALAAAAAVPFLRAACRWAARAPLRHGGRSAGGADDDDESDGDAASRHALCALLHAECARACVGAGPEFFADAQRHYLEADSAPEFGAFLWSWARGTAGGAAAGSAGGGAGGSEGAISGVRPLLPVSGGVGAGGGGGEGVGGYAHEADLFLARGVLQLLCCGDLGGANATRDAFLAAAKADASSTSSADGAGATSARALAAALDSPLSHFLRFLLLTLEVRLPCVGGLVSHVAAFTHPPPFPCALSSARRAPSSCSCVKNTSPP